MSTITEIESAIAKLPAEQVDELATWLEHHRAHRISTESLENWLKSAGGAGRPGVTTDQIMKLTRGEE